MSFFVRYIVAIGIVGGIALAMLFWILFISIFCRGSHADQSRSNDP